MHFLSPIHYRRFGSFKPWSPSLLQFIHGGHEINISDPSLNLALRASWPRRDCTRNSLVSQFRPGTCPSKAQIGSARLLAPAKRREIPNSPAWQPINSMRPLSLGCEPSLNCSMNGIGRRQKMKNSLPQPNVNVPLRDSGLKPVEIAKKSFPCPVCAVSLGIRIARTGKPYCVCMDCGIQIFFRGKLGIIRLERILQDESLVTGSWSSTNAPELLFNRIQHLKQRKAELERKQRLIFPDSDLENAICAIDNEIARVQGELQKCGQNTQMETKR